jgi:hypothetical protein
MGYSSLRGACCLEVGNDGCNYHDRNNVLSRGSLDRYKRSLASEFPDCLGSHCAARYPISSRSKNGAEDFIIVSSESSFLHDLSLSQAAG